MLDLALEIVTLVLLLSSAAAVPSSINQLVELEASVGASVALALGALVDFGFNFLYFPIFVVRPRFREEIYPFRRLVDDEEYSSCSIRIVDSISFQQSCLVRPLNSRILRGERQKCRGEGQK